MTLAEATAPTTPAESLDPGHDPGPGDDASFAPPGEEPDHDPAAHHFDIQPGQYKARGVEGSEQEGAGAKGEQVAIDLVLVDLNGRTVTTILHFSPDATRYSIDRLKALGWDGGDSFTGISKNEVPVLITYEEYQGKTRMKVEIVASRFSFKVPLSDVEKRGFRARLKQIAAQQESAGPAAPGAAPTPRAGVTYPNDWDKGAPDASRPALKI